MALAREHRDAASCLLKAATDPSVDRKQTAAVQHIEHATTFEAVAREWHAQQVPSRLAMHAADVLNGIEQDVFPNIGSTPAAAVTSPMVLQLVRGSRSGHRYLRRRTEIAQKWVDLLLDGFVPAAQLLEGTRR